MMTTEEWNDKTAGEPRADLTQAPAPVRVKPLVWLGPSGDPEPWENYGWEQYAKSVAGSYRVFNRGGLWRTVIHRTEDAFFVAETETIVAAKAAAQADYEARIIAALEAPDAGVVVELVEALRLADAALSGANMNMAVVEKKVKAALVRVGVPT